MTTTAKDKLFDEPVNIFDHIPKSMRLKLSKPIIYHVIFWVIYFVLNGLRWGSYYDDYLYSFQSNLIGFSIHIPLSYYHAYYLLPKYIPSKKYSLYLLNLGISLVVMMYLKVFLTQQFLLPVWPEAGTQAEIFSTNHVIAIITGELYVLGLTTSISLTRNWILNQKKTRELEKQNMMTELNLLKSQIQPHFLFNTLNNIYSLTLDKSDQASDAVMKLSELMSYMLYQKESRVNLADELYYMNNYLDLEKLRFGNRLDLTFDIEGKAEDVRVPQLLFLPFIENTFKHGVKNKLNSIEISLNLKISEDFITFEVENPNIDQTPLPFILPVQTSTQKTKTGGFGLSNARRRLRLLYGDNYTLNINDGEEIFRVTLKIPRNEHNKMPNS
ncbi:sensor histidine kinase [Flammeovirga pectinis]|uniref:Sensor histidine kinase n=1 Tax=Flammeovirga pectinis TaxID=2494373 RepID=A0A3Q9FSH9_9BACT|nr:histidine kinase [Flammeovirga pectinis]AZQ63657.1 sensor histidine kinase [Flammeovirga pectinis]